MISVVNKLDGRLLFKPDPEQEAIIFYGYSHHEPSNNFSELLRLIRTQNGFIQCGCRGEIDNPPMLGTRKTKSGYLVLVNLPGKKPHIDSCSLHYDKSAEKLNPINIIDEIYVGLISTEKERITFNEPKFKKLYKQCLDKANLNIFLSEPVSKDQFENRIQKALESNAEFSPIKSKVSHGLDKCSKHLKDLATSSELDFRLVFDVITDFDEYSVIRQFDGKKPFRVNVGRLLTSNNTNKGPFCATILLVGMGGKSFPIAAFVEPIYSIERPIPIRNAEVRELLDVLCVDGKKSFCEWLTIKSGSVPEVIIPLKPSVTPLNNELFDVTLEIKLDGIKVYVADPLKQDRNKYSESGYLVWHRSLSAYPVKRQEELNKLKSRIAGAILTN